MFWLCSEKKLLAIFYHKSEASNFLLNLNYDLLFKCYCSGLKLDFHSKYNTILYVRYIVFLVLQHAFSIIGKKTTLMSVKDFYNSITPGSTLTHGTGRGVYTRVEDKDIGSQDLYDQEKVPVRDSILNKIQRNGLLTFVDFAFLLNILSTPRRYMDIAFHAFDVSADGNCEAKVREFLRPVYNVQF